MKVVQCKNKHFYDSDMYPKCPHCGELPIGSDNNQVSDKKETSKSGWNPFKKRTKTESVSSVPQQITEKENTTEKMEIVDIPAKEDVTVSTQRKDQYTDDVTVSFSPEKTEDEHTVVISEDSRVAEKSSPSEQDQEKTVAMAAVAESKENAEAKVVENEEKDQSQKSAKISLREAVSMASADTEGRTMSYFSMLSSNATQNTTAVKEETAGVKAAPEVAARTAEAGNEQAAVQRIVDFPVGWLVCISGQHLGNTFMLSAGKNAIGRLSSNQVALVRDPSVSREKHASVVYEPKKRVFYLQPGDSSGLTYLNDEYIDSSKMIQAYDVIEVGDTRLMLLPLCSDQFTWDEYIK